MTVTKDCDEAGTIECLFEDLDTSSCECPLAVLCDDGSIAICEDTDLTEDECKDAECELRPETIHVICGKEFGETTTCLKDRPICEDFGLVCNNVDIKSSCEPTDGPTKTVTCAFDELDCGCPTVAKCDDGSIVECPGAFFSPEECKENECSGGGGIGKEITVWCRDGTKRTCNEGT